jgi:kynurenine formamidase
VLVDLAHHLGREAQLVGFDEWEEVLRADDVVIEPGDVVLIHTGFATEVLAWDRNPDPVRMHAMCASLDGRDPRLREWIADSAIAALAADNYAVESLGQRDLDAGRHSFLPIHHLCLFRLGVPLGEMWYLDELAQWLRRHGRNRFLLTAPPLRLPGVVGSPVTPIATV